MFQKKSILCKSCENTKGGLTLFESNRIQLRKFSEDDILTYYKWHNDIDVMSSTTLTLDKYSLQDTENFASNLFILRTLRAISLKKNLRIFQLVLLL